MKFIKFFLSIYPFMIIPGPVMILLFRSVTKFGILKTNFYILGILTSVIFFTSLSIIGVIGIVEFYPKSFLVFRFLGSIYLFILGLKVFLHSLKQNNNINTKKNINKTSYFKQYLCGLGVDLANPLSILGISSIILSTVSPSDAMSVKFSYFVITIFAAVCYLYTYVFLFNNKITKSFILPRINIIERLSGIMVCFIGTIFFFNALENLV